MDIVLLIVYDRNTSNISILGRGIEVVVSTQFRRRRGSNYFYTPWLHPPTQ